MLDYRWPKKLKRYSSRENKKIEKHKMAEKSEKKKTGLIEGCRNKSGKIKRVKPNKEEE